MALDGACRERHLERAIFESRRSRRDGGGLYRDGASLASRWKDQGNQARGSVIALPDSRGRDTAHLVDAHGRGFIYAIVNRQTHRIYVGLTIDTVLGRMSLHKTKLRQGRHSSRPLQADWDAYGDEAICCELLERVQPVEAREREAAWMEWFNDAGADLYNPSPLTKALHDRVCPGCGAAFRGVYLARWCGNNCRSRAAMKAWRERRKLHPRIKELAAKPPSERTKEEQAELEALWEAASPRPTGAALALDKLRKRYGL